MLLVPPASFTCTMTEPPSGVSAPGVSASLATSTGRAPLVSSRSVGEFITSLDALSPAIALARPKSRILA